MLIQHDGGANAVKQTEQAKVLLNRKDNPVKCFNCGGIHSIMVCPLISKEEGNKIMQDRRTKWAAEQAARHAGK